MIIYYRYFHSKGPIAWKYGHEDIELNNKISKPQSDVKFRKDGSMSHVRSFKSTAKQETDDKPPLYVYKKTIQKIQDVKEVRLKC